MNDLEDDGGRERRWPAMLLLAVALVWLGAAAAITLAGAQDYATLSDADPRQLVVIFGSFVLQLLPPLAVAVLAMALVGRQRPQPRKRLEAIEARHAAAAEATMSIARDLAAVDTMLDRIAARVGNLRDAAAVQGGGLTASATHLDAAATRLVESATRARDSGNALTAALPEADARAQRLTALLDASSRESKRQLSEVETMLTSLTAATEDAAARHQAAVAGAQDRLVALGLLAEKTAATVSEQGDALRFTATGALDATTAALDATRAGVDAQTAALLASVDQARVALDHIGGEAMRVMQGRLDRLLEATDTLGQSLGEQDARSRVFIETVERSFSVLDAKVGNAAAHGNATLDDLASRMQGVRDTAHRLGEPFDTVQAAVGELEAMVARLEQAAVTAIASLGTDLPATHDGVVAIARDVESIREHLNSLMPPIDAGNGTVQRIVAGLGDAKMLAVDVENATGTGAIAASNKLIEVLGQVREVAAATAGTMRETLGGVVAEAQAALAEAGGDTARDAFGAPVRTELDAVREAIEHAATAAQGVADRVAQRLLGLTQVVATVEARIDEVDTAYDIKLRDDLGRRAEALVTSLNEAAIDIAQLLQVEVGDNAWSNYLRGERSSFTRSAVRLLESGTERKMARHFAHDPEFALRAVRFVSEFDTLLARVNTDREGKSLAIALLTSDIGRLYVVLAEAAEKQR